MNVKIFRNSLNINDADQFLYQAVKLKIELSINNKERMQYPGFPPTALVSFPGSGRTWLTLLISKVSGFPCTCDPSQDCHVPGSIVAASHHFPPEPEYDVGFIFDPEIFFDDITRDCIKHLNHSDLDNKEILQDCAKNLSKPIKDGKTPRLSYQVPERLNQATYTFESTSIETKQLYHNKLGFRLAETKKATQAYTFLAQERVVGRVSTVLNFYGRGVLLMRNPFEAILSWWRHYMDGE